MIKDPPAPSKRAFGHPLPAEAVEYFLHPHERSAFHVPGLDEAGEWIYAASGYAAMRYGGALLDIDPLERVAAMRLSCLPWDRFDLLEDKKGWRELDDVAGTLWRNTPRPIWERTRDAVYIRTGPTVRVGPSITVPLSLLQLCARLPRAEVYPRTQEGHPLFIRFNKGQVIIPQIKNLPDPLFTLFWKPGSTMQSGLGF